MKFNLQNLVRDNVKALTPYSSARDEFTGDASVFLDANENPYDTSVNRYPDPQQRTVKENLYDLKGIDPENIFLGNGSDEAIDLIFRAFCNPSVDNAIVLPPTYGMYGVSAKINDIKIKEVLLTDDFQPNTEEILNTANNYTKIIFICSPNNPTGNLIEKTRVEKILTGFNGLVVVDEAYIDYSPGKSVLPLLKKYQNLIVLQTFSKAWGLAGIRLGMAFASKEIVQILNKIKPPYNVDSLSQSIAIKALQRGQPEMLKEQIKQRGKLAEKLNKFRFVEKVYPSDANFLLVKMKDASKAYDYLIDNDIVTRKRNAQPLCENCLRISVGTPGENKRLLEVLEGFK